VVIYPASGTGAWEAALVNTLSPGDTVLAFETGHFATLWRAMAGKLGLVVDFFNAISEKALEASANAGLPKS
jgi:alanine-glyoxylate transaminase/serine-glyoxylate transaminase/serine-pyruvate transaminase